MRGEQGKIMWDAFQEMGVCSLEMIDEMINTDFPIEESVVRNFRKHMTAIGKQDERAVRYVRCALRYRKALLEGRIG